MSRGNEMFSFIVEIKNGNFMDSKSLRRNNTVLAFFH